MDFLAVIVAAGSSQRAGPGAAKQWRLLGGKPVARWSLEALLAAGARRVVVVVAAGDEAAANAAFEGLEGWRLAQGGATRDRSVVAGLEALEAAPEDIVLIHDAARPLVEARHVEALVATLDGADGALPALAVADTLKRAAPGAATGLAEVTATVERAGLWRAQTPQAFRAGALSAAYADWPEHESPTDDAAVVERAGGRIVLTPGDPRLMKLTYPEDFAMAELLAGGGGGHDARGTIRIGQGFDAHRFGPGDRVWLCGVPIAHDRTLIGHSDADAGLHALTDALLGAIGEGDIGDHFPPSDPQWKGVASSVFLAHAAELIAARGGRIINVDVTLICERPKIKPHREAMRTRVAELLALPLDRVSVKATTTEAMGFTGREEGLAAQAVASVEMPG
jgi:2-C-methyl-D-erythritol 4-phosphate cytidylyltransferase/2-C-methyl-D-erythritol 2,4-cyclodiphosphate synthase